MAKLKLKNIRKYEQKTIKETYSEYLDYCMAIGQRPRTLESKQRFYTYSLLKWVDEQSTLDVFNRAFVEKIVISMIKDGYKGNTYQTFIIKLKAFLTYCMKRNYIAEFEVKIPNVDWEKKTIYTETELNKLLKKPNLNTCLIGDYKGWVTVNFLLGTGCRAETLLNIKVADIDFERESIIFKHMKTRKEITVPMSNTLKTVLAEYIQVLGFSNDMLLFPKLNGEKMPYDTLHQNITTYFKNRDIQMRGINTFRNTFSVGANGFNMSSNGVTGAIKYMNYIVRRPNIKNGTVETIQLPNNFIGKQIDQDFSVTLICAGVNSNTDAQFRKDAVRNMFINVTVVMLC